MSTVLELRDKQSAIDAISKLGEEDLIYLNRLIVERLKLIAQAKSTTLLARLNVGSMVLFTGPDGRKRTRQVSRLNKKTASVLTQDGTIWNVSPGLLERVHAA